MPLASYFFGGVLLIGRGLPSMVLADFGAVLERCSFFLLTRASLDAQVEVDEGLPAHCV
jgi:hypothetical protein